MPALLIPMDELTKYLVRAEMATEVTLTAESFRDLVLQAMSAAAAIRELEAKLDAEREKAPSFIGGNTGHGHVWERPDGIKARCGGPGICAECSKDQAAVMRAKEFAGRQGITSSRIEVATRTDETKENASPDVPAAPANLEPVMYMDGDGSTLDLRRWNEASDRTKEWYNIPLYALLPRLERDAERYRARRYTIYKNRLRIEMPQGKNWRPTTFEDFCAEYDAACDKEIEKQATEISRLKGERSK